MTWRPTSRVGAKFSPCRTWRYLIWRIWNPDLPVLPWVLANPSIADEAALDPTLRRVRNFSMREGAGGFIVANLCALVATNPYELQLHTDPVGPENDETLRLLVEGEERVVVGWGSIGNFNPERVALVSGILKGRTFCLGRTAKGQPRHPLYLPSTAPMRPWSPSGEEPA